MVMYKVTDHELDMIAGISGSVCFGLFGISFGCLVSFAIVLHLTDFTNNPSARALYGALLFASVVLSIFFAIMSVLDTKKARAKLKELKSQPTA
jgi:bacteriorhodopsin